MHVMNVLHFIYSPYLSMYKSKSSSSLSLPPLGPSHNLYHLCLDFFYTDSSLSPLFTVCVCISLQTFYTDTHTLSLDSLSLYAEVNLSGLIHLHVTSSPTLPISKLQSFHAYFLSIKTFHYLLLSLSLCSRGSILALEDVNISFFLLSFFLSLSLSLSLFWFSSMNSPKLYLGNVDCLLLVASQNRPNQKGLGSEN